MSLWKQAGGINFVTKPPTHFTRLTWAGAQLPKCVSLSRTRRLFPSRTPLTEACCDKYWRRMRPLPQISCPVSHLARMIPKSDLPYLYSAPSGGEASVRTMEDATMSCACVCVCGAVLSRCFAVRRAAQLPHRWDFIALSLSFCIYTEEKR